jgi:hypothetical protein
VQSDHLQAELVIPASDLVHAMRRAGSGPGRLTWDVLDDCALVYADQIVEDFIIRDESGDPLSGTLRDITHDFTDRTTRDQFALRSASVTYRLEYPLSAAPRYLSLQQSFFSAGSHPAQLALAVSAGQSDTKRIVQLSNRGNVETVRITRAAESETWTLDQPPEFHALLADVSINSTGVSVNISMPLSLLSTWRPLPDRDFLNPAEQTAVRTTAADQIASANIVSINQVQVAPRLESVRLLDPLNNPAEQLYTGSARIVARLNYAHAGSPQDMNLHWTLFNNAVLMAAATLQTDGSAEHHELNTYSPDLRWRSIGQSRVEKAARRSNSTESAYYDSPG